METSQREKRFFKGDIILIFVGILINFVGTKLVEALNLPLYFDSIGTILTSALSGFLPGMIVGFLSIVINSIGDPISLYYGVLSVGICYLCKFVFKKRFLSLSF